MLEACLVCKKNEGDRVATWSLARKSKMAASNMYCHNGLNVKSTNKDLT